IEALAFANNRLTSVTLAKSVTAIAGFAFADNQQMSGMVRPGVIDPTVDNQITSVTIGADVALGTNDEGRTYPAFSGGFDDFYNNNGKKAGTYTYRNGKWRFKR
ncbi:MAG: hypothetical protein LBC60_00450, partial [Spirochaetaceae bacterium]|nr:hypothetical protein [Spirochaetaceae bacterium]